MNDELQLTEIHTCGALDYGLLLFLLLPLRLTGYAVIVAVIIIIATINCILIACIRFVISVRFACCS